jgi:hypothetical protein
MIMKKVKDIVYDQHPDVTLSMKQVPVPIFIDFDFMKPVLKPKAEGGWFKGDVDTMIEELENLRLPPCNTEFPQNTKVATCSNLDKMDKLFRAKRFRRLQTFITKNTDPIFNILLTSKKKVTFVDEQKKRKRRKSTVTNNKKSKVGETKKEPFFQSRQNVTDN